MKITIDENACVGCGLCVSGCPEVFEMADNGIAKVKAVKAGCGCDLKEVASQCPVTAIIVE
jgi:ferredoxin